MKREAPEAVTGEQFREAVDHRLSGLEEDLFLARRIIAQAGKEKKMKKKISVGLAVAFSLVLVFSAALAENWQTVSEYMSTIGSHPDLISNQPGNTESAEPFESLSIYRDVIERVYAPVTLTVVYADGSTSDPISLNAQVAQIEYRYDLIFYQESDERAVYPESPRITAPEIPSEEKLPFAPYLYEDSTILSLSYDTKFSTRDESFFIQFKGTYSLVYNAEIMLNEQGQIIETKTDTVQRQFNHQDDNGFLPENFYEIPFMTRIPYATISPLSPEPSPAPMAASETVVPPVPVPTLGSGSQDAETLVPPMPVPTLGSETQDAEASVPPLSGEADHPSYDEEQKTKAAQETAVPPVTGLQYGDNPAEKYYDTLLFGAPYTVHYFDQEGTALTIVNEDCSNMCAHFNRDQFEDLADFRKQDGPVETDYELLLLGAGRTGDGTILSFEQLEKPEVNVYYQKDFYYVRFTGGKFRAQYPTDLYYSPEAYQQIDDDTWTFNPSSKDLIGVDYATGEYAYNFTFRLRNPENYCVMNYFGKELPPISYYYVEADGTEKNWEMESDHFEAYLQEQAVTRLVDLSGGKQTLEYQDSFISFRSYAIPELPRVTVLEKPECVVTPQSDGYEMRVAGGLMRLTYRSVNWRQEKEDGTIVMLARPDGTETYTTVEIPFDFSFIVPVYDDPFEG